VRTFGRAKCTPSNALAFSFCSYATAICHFSRG
jgi:hypothetical protein